MKSQGIRHFRVYTSPSSTVPPGLCVGSGDEGGCHEGPSEFPREQGPREGSKGEEGKRRGGHEDS